MNAIEISSSKGFLPIGIAEDNVATKAIAKGNPIAIGEVDAQDNELCEYWDYQNQILDSD